MCPYTLRPMLTSLFTCDLCLEVVYSFTQLWGSQRGNKDQGECLFQMGDWRLNFAGDREQKYTPHSPCFLKPRAGAQKSEGSEKKNVKKNEHRELSDLRRCWQLRPYYNAGQKKRNSDPWNFCELPGRGRSTLKVVDYWWRSVEIALSMLDCVQSWAPSFKGDTKNS